MVTEETLKYQKEQDRTNRPNVQEKDENGHVHLNKLKNGFRFVLVRE